MSLTPEERLIAVRAELDAAERERNDAGLCACPCGGVLPASATSRTKYLGDRHRNRQHRERVKAEAGALGVPERQSLKTLQRTARTGERRADAPAPRKRAQRRPRAGVSLYLPDPKLVEAVVELAAGLGRVTPEDLDALAEAARKAKARLDRRRAAA